MQIVECVPNFSEGKDQVIIQAIADAISSTEGVKLLNVDPGADTNRTVVTFIGEPAPVAEAAFRAIKKAAELIDMRKHSGAHPRLGATDVCPFIPVANMTMDECVALAGQVGQRVAKELDIPIYLYEFAATRPERKNLADIRQGEYEGLAQKLQDPEWAPDFDKAVFNAKSGATVIGARKFLIAYNVNLNTKDRRLAQEVALNIRESGRSKRDEHGEIVRDAEGKAIKVPGLLNACKAVGWYIEEYQFAQVSINLTDFEETPVHIAFETVVEEAQKLGLRVTGSELVGLIPLTAILDAGKFYLQRQGKSIGQPESEIIRMAVQSMGLNQISRFDPLERIIEYHIDPPVKPLVGKTVSGFVDELSTDSPAPGGGSVAALCGALAGALGSMVANLTVGRKGHEQHTERLSHAAAALQQYKKQLLNFVDQDTDAFNALMSAMRLPKKSPEQQQARNDAMERATQNAIRIPLEVSRTAWHCLEQISGIVEIVNPNAISDLGVACYCAETAAQGASLNVRINLKSVQDEVFRKATLADLNNILLNVARLKKTALENVARILNA